MRSVPDISSTLEHEQVSRPVLTVLSLGHAKRVRSLFHQAASNLTFLNKEISMISKFMSWNGFAANVWFSIIPKLKA